MTYVDNRYLAAVPRLPPLAALNYATHAVTASGNSLVVVFEAPKTGTLEKIEFALRTVTQAPASGLKVSFQDLNSSTPATGDGVVDQYRVVSSGLTSNAWIVPGAMTSDGTDTGTKRSVSRGDLVAAKIEFNAFASGDSLQLAAFQNVNAALGKLAGIFPYALGNGAAMHSAPCLAIKYTDGTYYGPSVESLPISSLTSSTFASNSTPDEQGNLIVLDSPKLVAGLWALYRPNGDADLCLYDSGGTLLGSRAHAASLRIATFTDGIVQRLFTTPLELAAGTYYVTLKPTTTTSVIGNYIDVNSVGLMGAMDLGTNCYYASRTDGGAFSTTSTRRFFAGLVLSGDQSGGGGIPVGRIISGGV